MSSVGDKKGNITAAFGSDVILEGVTGVPNLILKYYSKLGITDSEMMLIIQLMYAQTSANQHFPLDSDLAQVMFGDKSVIKADLASLIEKGIIGISPCYCEASDDISQTYSFEPLFEKISELWACEKVKAYQHMKKMLKEQKQKVRAVGNSSNKPSFSLVSQAFEKEFGRLLSPMEIERINLWLEESSGEPELIMEALKRAVMLGKHNFKYIDSILFEWHKNKLFTLADIAAHEAKFRNRQLSKTSRRKTAEQTEPGLKKDKFRLLYHF